MNSLKIHTVCLLTGHGYVVPEETYCNLYNKVAHLLHFNEETVSTDKTVFDVVSGGLKTLALNQDNYRFIYLAEQEDKVWCFDRNLKLINPSTLREI